jgi:predicted  nucleic acid-binding Zn-ribbon protein
MAGLRDHNGRIVIDEREAAADVRKIDEAITKITSVIKKLDPAKIDDRRFLGEARDGFDDFLDRIRKDLSDMKTKCEAAKKLINDAVAKYQRIDRELKDAMRF